MKLTCMHAWRMTQLEYSVYLNRIPYINLDSIETEVRNGGIVQIDYDVLRTHRRTLVTYVEEFALNNNALSRKLGRDRDQTDRLIAYAQQEGYVPRIVVDDISGILQSTIDEVIGLGIELVDARGDIIK